MSVLKLGSQGVRPSNQGRTEDEYSNQVDYPPPGRPLKILTGHWVFEVKAVRLLRIVVDGYVNACPSPVEAAGRLPELKMMKGVWSSKKQARRSVEFKCCTRLSFVDQGQVKTPTRGGL